MRALAVLASAAVGGALIFQLKIGLALFVALCYVPVALTDLGAGLAVWIALPFLSGISALNLAGKGAGLLVAGAWLGVVGQRRAELWRAIRINRRAFWAVAGLMVWVTLSTAWASDPTTAFKDLWHWYAVALIFVIVVSTMHSRRVAQMVVLAFVVGAVLSVAYGLAGGVSGSQAANVASYGGRLGGANGDPNFLAAGIVPAIALAAVLIAVVKEIPERFHTVGRTGLVLALTILTIGLVATASRGGLVAFIVGLLLSFVLFPGQRRWVMSVVLILVAVVAVGFTAYPSALDRVTSVGNGSGRTDQWTVALRIVRAHPIGGVGDANYVVVARDYTRQPGTLTEARYLVDSPEVAHNTYLQFVSETGIIGLLLFVAVAVLCLASGFRAARRFRALGDRVMENVSRAVVVASVAMLTASGFISAGVDQRLWALLALGPAMLTLASSSARGLHRALPAGFRPNRGGSGAGCSRRPRVRLTRDPAAPNSKIPGRPHAGAQQRLQRLDEICSDVRSSATTTSTASTATAALRASRLMLNDGVSTTTRSVIDSVRVTVALSSALETEPTAPTSSDRALAAGSRG